MRTILTISLLTLREGLRYRLIYGVLVFTLLFMGISVLISGMFMRDILKIILDLCLSAVSAGGLLVPFFLAITMLSKDIEQKTIYTVLAKPISRTNYILGRYFGLTLLTATVMGILTVASLFTVWAAMAIFNSAFFTSLSLPSILLSSVLAFFGVLVLNSTVVLWCCITTSSLLATLLTIATYMVGQTVEDMVRFIAAKIPGVEITPLVQKVVNITLYVFPNLAAFDVKQLAAHGLAIPLQETVLLVVYALSYITIMLATASLIFQRRDLT